MHRKILIIGALSIALLFNSYGQSALPKIIKTEYVQCTLGSAKGEEARLDPIEYCTFFYMGELKNNILKYSDCDALEDVEEIVITNEEKIKLTGGNSWSKSYFGYSKKHPEYLDNGQLISNSHIILIYLKNKYSILIEEMTVNKSSGATISSIANMHYNL